MMALVQNLNASALDLGVSASVPAPIPGGSPVITSPTNNTVTTNSSVKVSGTCPVIVPPILIVIYRDSNSVGSTNCTPGGSFSLNVPLTLGKNNLLAQVQTITGGIGNSSSVILVTRNTLTTPSSPPSSEPGPISTPNVTIELPILEPQIITEDNFTQVPSDSNKPTAWSFSIKGGETPFTVTIDWGDGTIEKYTVHTHKVQTFYHTYSQPKTYNISAKVVDANGRVTVYNTVAVAYSSKGSGTLGLDSKYQETHPIIALLQQYLWQIYIATLGALVFLWYLEHGRFFHRRLKH